MENVNPAILTNGRFHLFDDAFVLDDEFFCPQSFAESRKHPFPREESRLPAQRNAEAAVNLIVLALPDVEIIVTKVVSQNGLNVDSIPSSEFDISHCIVIVPSESVDDRGEWFSRDSIGKSSHLFACMSVPDNSRAKISDFHTSGGITTDIVIVAFDWPSP